MCGSQADLVYRGKIGSIGFCWGARYVLLLARDDAPTQIDVGVTYHASFVTEADVEGISRVPVAFFKGTADWMFSDSFLDQVSCISFGYSSPLCRRLWSLVSGPWALGHPLNQDIAREQPPPPTWR